MLAIANIGKSTVIHQQVSVINCLEHVNHKRSRKSTTRKHSNSINGNSQRFHKLDRCAYEISRAKTENKQGIKRKTKARKSALEQNVVERCTGSPALR
jgi:transposase-like protein